MACPELDKAFGSKDKYQKKKRGDNKDGLVEEANSPEESRDYKHIQNLWKRIRYLKLLK